MKTHRTAILVAMALLASLPALAQDADHSWSKTYSLTGKPSLTFETSDAAVDFHSCGECHAIRIHVEVAGHTLSDYRLEESQTGNEVRFLFKERPHIGIVWHREQTHVTVETPAQLTLEAKTSDGNVTLSGLEGELGLTSGDGDLTADHVAGSLRIHSGDGHVKITDAQGALEARMSDGTLSVDGLFHSLTLHTSDGRLDVNLREGSKLTEPSSILSSDGSVTVHVPRSFAADLDVHTSDGHVDCTLPLTIEHYSSGGHGLQGRLNGGGTPLTIHTSDGNVTLSPM
ncbi:MAG TPA: DUF4097 family beta strand repeat-containing protein [Acidobacteriaceae bacterium]|jgi:hypothetical protein